MRRSFEPHPQAPEWSPLQELAAGKSSTRVHEALISQPMCTTIQIALVDLLQNLGIHFSVVVGHFSREIGAAHAAGLLWREKPWLLLTTEDLLHILLWVMANLEPC